MRRPWCILIATALLAVTVDGYADDGQAIDPVPPPFFDVDDIEEPDPAFTVHGRVDVTIWRFEDDRNMDGFDDEGFNSLGPAVTLTYRLAPAFSVAGEFELDGLEGAFELDKLYLRVETPESDSGFTARCDFGVNYVPFGQERHYYSSMTNPLVDRPSPFRRVFPGSYSDLGAFAATEYERDAFGVIAELAVHRGLRGPERDDRPSGLLRGDDETQTTGRIGALCFDHLSFGVSGLSTFTERQNGTGHRRLHLLGFDTVWRSDDWFARFEYVEGGYEGRPAEGGNIRRNGWYAELWHRFPIGDTGSRAIETVLRYDTVDENSRVRDFRDANRWAFGVNWRFHDRIRLKCEYVISNERGESIANNGALVQLEARF